MMNNKEDDEGNQISRLIKCLLFFIRLNDFFYSFKMFIIKLKKIGNHMYNKIVQLDAT